MVSQVQRLDQRDRDGKAAVHETWLVDRMDTLFKSVSRLQLLEF